MEKTGKTINMFAAEYAKHSGYPLVTIKKYCKAGILPCDRLGRKYLINVELADQAILNRMRDNLSNEVVQADDLSNGSSTTQETVQGAKVFNFVKELRALRTGG